MRISRTAITFISFAGILIGGGILFAKWMSAPVTTSKSVTTQNEVLSSKITLKPFTTPYFTTLLPDTLVLKSQSENSNAPIMGNYLFKDSNIALSDQLAISVGKLNGDSVDAISAAKLRETKPDEYNKIVIANLPAGAVAYARIDGYEKAVFWPKGTDYIALVISGSIQRKSQLDQVLQTTVANWQ